MSKDLTGNSAEFNPWTARPMRKETVEQALAMMVGALALLDETRAPPEVAARVDEARDAVAALVKLSR